MTPIARAAVVAVLIVLAASCGGGTASTASGSRELINEINQVRAAAGAHDVASATARLDDIRRTVAVLKRQRNVSDATAGRILLAADEVESELALISEPSSTVRTSTSTTAPTIPPTTDPVPPAKGHRRKGHGKDGGD